MHSKTSHKELSASFLDFLDVLQVMQKRIANPRARIISLCGAHTEEFVVAMGGRGRGIEGGWEIFFTSHLVIATIS